MDHPLLMREFDGLADFEEESQPLSHGKFLLAHVACDRNTIDVFHHKVGQAIISRSGVEQPSDVRMIEARKNPALSVEAAQDLIRVCAPFQKLDRNFLLELSVGPFR